MATIKLLGRTFDVPPYKLSTLRVVAPAIDRINTTANSLRTLEGVVGAADDLVVVIAAGLVKIDPELTAEALGDQLGVADMPAIRDAFLSIMADTGMASGEAPATLAAESKEALPTESATSSLNS